MRKNKNDIAAWEDVVLRAIAFYKLAKALLFFAVGFGLLQLIHHDVAQFLRDDVIEPFHFNSESRFIDWLLDEAGKLTSHKIVFLSSAVFLYGIVFTIEGIGLYLRKHWAEYMVAIVTGSLLPLEIYEIYLKLAWWKFGVLLGNFLILAYLIHRLVLDARNAKKRQADLALTAGTAPTTQPKPPLSRVL